MNNRSDVQMPETAVGTRIVLVKSTNLLKYQMDI